MAIKGYAIDEIREKIKETGKNLGFELDFYQDLSLLITKDKIYVKSWDPTCTDTLSIPEMPFNFEDSLDKVLYTQIEDFDQEELEDFLLDISNQLKKNPQGTMWDDIRIEIVNKPRVKEFFEGCDLDNIELTEEDNKLMRIIGANLAYFTKIDQDLLREFYEETGIVLAHRVEDKNGERYYFTMHGYGAENSGEWYNNVRDEHIVMLHTKPEEVDFSKSREIKFSNETFELNYKLSSEELMRSEGKKAEKRKKSILGTFGELFLLDEDGVLFRDKKEYAKNVLKLIRLGVGTKYIIYKDDSIEPIESYCHPGRCDGFDKVIAENGMIALLKKDDLILLTASDESIGYAEHYFSGVNDIEFDEGLLIKSGEATIKMQVDEYSPCFVGI